MKSFSRLKINDYAIPFSSVNLFFFKPTLNVAIILYTKEETIKSGQLLGFKSQLTNYGHSLEKLLEGNFKPVIEAPSIEEGPTSSFEPTIREEINKFDDKIREIPYLTRSINPKGKFEISESVVLNLIDNKLCIEDICEKSNLKREKVNGIIKKYREKGWVRVRIVEPESKNIKPLKIFPKLTEPVSLTIGFLEDEQNVLKNCSGENSIEDIITITSLNKEKVIEILDKYEDKKWISFRFDGKPDYIPKNIKKLNPMGVQLGLMSPKEYKIRELCTGDVSAKSIAKSLETPYNELIQALKDMEKKGDIKLRLKKM